MGTTGFSKLPFLIRLVVVDLSPGDVLANALIGTAKTAMLQTRGLELHLWTHGVPTDPDPSEVLNMRPAYGIGVESVSFFCQELAGVVGRAALKRGM